MTSNIVEYLRETWPLVPSQGPVTSEQRQAIHLAADRIVRLETALEEIGGLDCVQAAFRTGKPCGVCVSCIARSALQNEVAK